MTLALYRHRFLIGLVGIFFLSSVPVFAANTVDTGFGNSVNTGFGNTVQTGQPANCGNGPCSIQNPLKVTSICGLLKAVLQGAIAVGTPVAVLFIIWSGFRFVLAQGNPKALGKAKTNFYYTILGIALFLGAWVLAMIIAATVNAIGGTNILTCN